MSCKETLEKTRDEAVIAQAVVVQKAAREYAELHGDTESTTSTVVLELDGIQVNESARVEEPVSPTIENATEEEKEDHLEVNVAYRALQNAALTNAARTKKCMDIFKASKSTDQSHRRSGRVLHSVSEVEQTLFKSPQVQTPGASYIAFDETEQERIILRELAKTLPNIRCADDEVPTPNNPPVVNGNDEKGLQENSKTATKLHKENLRYASLLSNMMVGLPEDFLTPTERASIRDLTAKVQEAEQAGGSYK